MNPTEKERREEEERMRRLRAMNHGWPYAVADIASETVAAAISSVFDSSTSSSCSSFDSSTSCGDF